MNRGDETCHPVSFKVLRFCSTKQRKQSRCMTCHMMRQMTSHMTDHKKRVDRTKLQAGFAEPPFILTMVGLGLGWGWVGVGLGWVWVGVGVKLGKKFGSQTRFQGRLTAGWLVGGWI